VKYSIEIFNISRDRISFVAIGASPILYLNLYFGFIASGMATGVSSGCAGETGEGGWA
jgi:hypothetical protein